MEAGTIPLPNEFLSLCPVMIVKRYTSSITMPPISCITFHMLTKSQTMAQIPGITDIIWSL